MDKKNAISLMFILISANQSVLAEDVTAKSTSGTLQLEDFTVIGNEMSGSSSTQHNMNQSEINSKRSSVSDTARLLEDVSGVSLQTSGGVTALPIIHGLNDDRVKTEIDGMIIPSACPNHMNPPLSYISPSNVGKIKVLKGVTPVSMGGDSIGGTISIESLEPIFAEPGKDILLNGEASAFYRSNGDAYGGSIAAGIANEHVRLDYTGSTSQSRNYFNGNDMEVKSTEYISQSHAATLAFKYDNHLLVIKGGQEHVPFQAYPNARMQMTANDGIYGNVHYNGAFDWGSVDAKLYMENTDHEMDVGPDQLPSFLKLPLMPMNSKSRNFGYRLQAEWLMDEQHSIKFGNEFHSHRLHDYWPPVFPDGYDPNNPFSCFDMCPDDFLNVNNGIRDRVGTFIEWEANWSPEWKTLLGLRYDHTMLDADDARGYNNRPLYTVDASRFNARDHQRNFDLFDVTALTQFLPNDWSMFEFGYARKNRAPSLYELYPWSHAAMNMTMIGWFGDGNAYVGNLDLTEETAHNISFTAEFFDPNTNSWSFKVTPYFSYVNNFIDADIDVLAQGIQPSNGFSYLQMANHDARLWGVDASGAAELYQDGNFGQFSTGLVMSYVRGERMDGGNLYHMMPFNLKLSLRHELGGWKNTMEMQFVDRKEDVQELRNELQTPSYILLNAKTSYKWKFFNIDVGVDNLLDKQYYHPLGGSYLGDYYAMTIFMAPQNNRAVPAMGRQVYVGVTLKY